MVSLWLRIGDGTGYEAHGDDLTGVIEALKAVGCGPVVEWRPGGVETKTHKGNNHISLYYGDENLGFKHDLDASEKRRVEDALKIRWHEDFGDEPSIEERGRM